MSTEARLFTFKDYAERGFAVFPLSPGEKRPLAKAAPHGCKSATADVNVVDQWTREYPDANIGLATGALNQLTIIDIDGADGEQSYRALCEELGDPQPAAVVLTPRGRHLYFAFTPGDCNRAAVRPGIDVRAEGGYVVAPGSTVEGLAYAPEGPMFWDVELSALPAAWRESLARKATNATSAPMPTPAPANGNGSQPVGGHSRNGARGDVIFRRYVSKSSPGTRNQCCFDMCAQLRDNNVDYFDACSYALAYAREVANLGDHLFTENEAMASCKSAYSREAREPWERRNSKPALAPSAATTPTTPTTDPATETNAATDNILGIDINSLPMYQPQGVEIEATPARAQVRSMEGVEQRAIDWLWPHVLVRGSINLLAGEGGTGKSTIALDIAWRVTVGNDMPIDAPQCDADTGELMERQPASVLMVDGENDPATKIAPYLSAHNADMSRFHYMRHVESADGTRHWFSLASDLPALREAIEQIGDCELVIIDPLDSFLGRADGNRSSEVRAILDPLQELAAELNVCVLIVCHFNKSSSTSIVGRISGSAALVNCSRVTWAATVEPTDGRLRLLMPVKRNAPPAPGSIAYWLHDDDIEWQSDWIATQADTEVSRMSLAMTFLRTELQNGPVPSKILAKKVPELRISQKTLERARAALGVEAYKDGTTWFCRLTT